MKLFAFAFSSLVFGFVAMTGNAIIAQENFDLEPPLQVGAKSQQIMHSPDPAALPTFRFAIAELDGSGKVMVATKVATQKLLVPVHVSVDSDVDPRGIPYTETVTQNYTVSVPYTENVDGKPVTRTRTETRTRAVPVIRFRKRNKEEQAEFDKQMAKNEEDNIPVIKTARTEQKTETYTVNVPYTEVVDGRSITKMRQEKRTRTVSVTRGETETKTSIDSETYELGKIKCFSVDGSELSQKAIQKRLGERQPVILINSPKGIAPYFKKLLKEDTIFMVCEDK